MQTADEQLFKARAALAGDPNVHSICFGLDRHAKLALCVHVEHATAMEGDIRGISLPVRIISRQMDDPCRSFPRQPGLNARTKDPKGGYNVGASREEMGTFGILGYMDNDKNKMVFCSADHVFRRSGKVVNAAYQPNVFDDASHIINDTSKAPVTTLYDKYGYDVIMFYVDQSKREWVRKSRSATVKDGQVTGSTLIPRTGFAYTGYRVKKVGARTGDTHGTVDHIAEKGQLFIRPDDVGATISCGGDSGAPWLNAQDSWIGINTSSNWQGGRQTFAVAQSCREIMLRTSFQPYYDKDEL